MNEQIIRDDERVRCRRQLEQFARRYVMEWKETAGAKAQGWAILQAADDLTRNPGTNG